MSPCGDAAAVPITSFQCRLGVAQHAIGFNLGDHPHQRRGDIIRDFLLQEVAGLGFGYRSRGEKPYAVEALR